MKVSSPILQPLFRSPAQAELLTLLFLNPDTEYSLSEAAQFTGAPLSSLHAEVKRLVDAGLVRDRRMGNVRLLGADTDSELAASLTELLSVSYGPRPAVTSVLTGIAGIDAAFVHGPWADRQLGQSSEVPTGVRLLIVGTLSDDTLDAVRAQLVDLLDSDVDLEQVSLGEWRQAVAEAASGTGAAHRPGGPRRELVDIAAGPLIPVIDQTDSHPAGVTPVDVTPVDVYPTSERTVVPAPDHTSEPASGGDVASSADSRTLCPLLSRLPVIGPHLPSVPRPHLPRPSVPTVVTQMAAGVGKVASLQWLPRGVLPVHVHLGPCPAADDAGH